MRSLADVTYDLGEAVVALERASSSPSQDAFGQVHQYLTSAQRTVDRLATECPVGADRRVLSRVRRLKRTLDDFYSAAQKTAAGQEAAGEGGASPTSQATNLLLRAVRDADAVIGVLNERIGAERPIEEGLYQIVLLLWSVVVVLVTVALVRGEKKRREAQEQLARYSERLEELVQERAAELQKAYEELREHREHLEVLVRQRTAHLDAINRELEAFTYAVSHDLRAPLRAVYGFCRALAEDYGEELDQRANDYLDRVCHAAERMGQLIEDLLNLSRISRGELRREDVDLTTLAREVAAELQEREPKRSVQFVIAEGLAARGDPRLLRVVLENLLGNAWKFTANRPQARIEFGAQEKQGQRVFFVRDNGVGFDMAYAEKLFVPFQRLHSPSKFEGSGIGLATVQRIIHRHGGRIWAEGEPERGATFYFTLEQAAELEE